MLVVAVILYFVGLFLAGPFGPIELTFGKAGLFGVLIGIGWRVLLFARLSH